MSNWLAAFWTPDINVVDKYSLFIGRDFQDPRTACNIALQTVIPGHRQSMGAAARVDKDISERSLIV